MAQGVKLFGWLGCLLLSILTRPAAPGIALIMLATMFAVHWTNSFFIASGYEYAFTLMMISICILLHGAASTRLITHCKQYFLTNRRNNAWDS